MRTDVPFKPLFFAASMIPLIIPGILYTVAWIFLASPDIGLLNKAVEPLLGPGFFDVFTHLGDDLGRGAAPVADRVPAHGRGVPLDGPLARGVGAHVRARAACTTFRRITVPLIRPAIVASILIMFVRSLESFEVPALLGLQNGIYVFTSRIYFVLRSYPPDLASAGALAIGLLVVAVLGVHPQQPGRQEQQELPDGHRQGLPPAADGARQVAARSPAC